jgi:hypothetical protein
MKPADNIEKRIVEKLHFKADDKMHDRILNEAIKAQEQYKKTKTAKAVPNIWRIIMKSRITKLAAAAVIIVAILAGIHYFGGPIDGASIAWADVVKPILTAQTVVYDIIVGEEGKDPVITDMVKGSRIRRTISNVPEAASVIDLETMKVLALDPGKKEAVIIDLKGLQKRLDNYLDNLRNIITDLQNREGFEAQKLGEKTIEGRQTVGFYFKHPKAELTIWADTETSLPLRIEGREGQMPIVCKNFNFDVPMDESLFSMEVPEGYTIKQSELDVQSATEEDFIEGLRIWAEFFGDGFFPASVAVEEFIRQVPFFGKKLDQMDISDEEKIQIRLKIQQHLLFIRFFKGEGKWHYAGNGVKLGDADTPIFWYRPKDSQTWRVIYGDLTVEDVAPEDLPQ